MSSNNLKETMLALIDQMGISEILLALAEITAETPDTRVRHNREHKGCKKDSPISYQSLATLFKENDKKWWTASEIAKRLKQYENLYTSPASFRVTIGSNLQR